MAEFTPITTQEDFDSRIRDRLERERKTVQQQFADYDTIRTSLGEKTKEAETLTAQLADVQKQFAEAQGQLKSSRSDLAKTRIALEKGLPMELCNRLTGDTEEELRQDAEELEKLFRKRTEPQPLFRQEPVTLSKDAEKDAALRSVIRSMRNQ